MYGMNQSERLGKPGEQRKRGSRLELLYALLVVGYDLGVTPVLEVVERRIDTLRERIESEIRAGALPDD